MKLRIVHIIARVGGSTWHLGRGQVFGGTEIYYVIHMHAHVKAKQCEVDSLFE